MFDQQSMMGFVHRATTKYLLQQKLNTGMVIIGKVTGTVNLSDIGRVLNFGATAHITEYEINKSKDLQEAIRRGWVEIIEDRGALKRAIVSTQGEVVQVPVPQQGFNKEEMISLAKEMAKGMASEMLKSNELVMSAAKEMASGMAKEMMKELNLNIQNITNVAPKEEKLKFEDVKPDNVVIDVDETTVQPQINEIGKVLEEKTDVSEQLEKMKRFKRRKTVNDTN
jgi:hypothetical protein